MSWTALAYTYCSYIIIKSSIVSLGYYLQINLTNQRISQSRASPHLYVKVSLKEKGKGPAGRFQGSRSRTSSSLALGALTCLGHKTYIHAHHSNSL